jgi:hypothetical protein
MSLGALIASDFELLPAELLGLIIEVRIEQHLDQPTAFAMRFADDICDGKPLVLGRKELEAGRKLSVIVDTPSGLRCLVHGPVAQTRSSFSQGGPGSWVEIRGRDRRAQLDRSCEKIIVTGRASDAARALLRDAGFEPDVGTTKKVYDEKTGTFNKRSTPLDILQQIAKDHGFGFWITTACRVRGGGRTVDVRETVHLKRSPDPTAKKLLSSGAPELAGVELVRFVVNPPRGECTTVNKLDVDVDYDRITQVDARSLDDKSLTEETVLRKDTPPPLDKGGRTLRDASAEVRLGCPIVPGTATDLHERADAALTESSWFVTCKVSTTAHMLGSAVEPHEIVSVQGVGLEHSGAYQVKSVVHVINPADHFMDIELRRNTIGKQRSKP